MYLFLNSSSGQRKQAQFQEEGFQRCEPIGSCRTVGAILQACLLRRRYPPKGCTHIIITEAADVLSWYKLSSLLHVVELNNCSVSFVVSFKDFRSTFAPQGQPVLSAALKSTEDDEKAQIK